LIRLEQLTRRYGDFVAVDALDLQVGRGEVFGFLGPNGAGKTTTIRMLTGVLAPSAGRALIDGLDCHAGRAEVMQRTGYLPDQPTFHDWLRGREVLQFVAEMHGLARGDAAERARELLADLGLGEAAGEFAANYSFGMKKKLALACALVHDPPVLVLDEPTNGLDPRAAREVQDRLRTAAEQGRTIFLSTHLLDMAERLCTRVGIIDRGRLVAQGAVGSLREQLATDGSLEEIFLRLTRPEEGAAT
jgi:ABC-2 type transport system ATP-binding protein